MPNEIELKLRIAAADLPRLRRHPAIRQHLVGKASTRKLTSVYFDTPDLKLLDAAISLRVRRMSGGWFQAVKGAGQSLAGLHQRMEWEDVIASGEPDFTKITKPGLARIFARQSLRDALRPIFTTEVQRTEWQLEYADGSAVEVALDIGKLQSGKKSEPIQELELELKRGKAVHLFELALALQADIPLHIENISKAQRGYAYYRPQAPAIFKARTVELSPKMSADQAFQQIAWECLRQLQGNQDMVLHGLDPEGVHQMRVGIRRLYVAIKLFKCKTQDLQNELDWLSTRLGSARDWDVLLHTTLPAALNQLQPHGGHGLLLQRATAAHQRAYARLRQALNSQRYQRLLLSLGGWLASFSHSPHTKVLKLANRRLQQSYSKLQQLGENLGESDPKQLHKLRIEAKYLRYASEFFTEIYHAQNRADKGQNKTRRFVDRLARLQAELGLLNDINVSATMIHQLASRQANPKISEAASLMLEWNAMRATQPLQQMHKTWQDFMQAQVFWN
jgi:inorganic triphosphatase YgiF